MGRKVLATLKAAKNGTVYLATGGVGTWTPQSMAFKSASTRYIICNVGSELGIQIATSKSHKKTNYRLYGSGHGNGATYCAKDGLIYTTTYAGSANKIVKSWNPKNNWKLVQTIKLPVYCTGIAYDPIYGSFYVSNSSGFSVFSYSEFTKKKGTKKHKTHSNKYSSVGFWQDIGGYNGVVMRCTSKQNTTSTSYIDCYRAVDGKYLGSLKTTGEIESVAVDSTGHFHVLYAKNRRVVKCSNTIVSVGLKDKAGTTSPTANVYAESQGNRIVREARKHIGEDYKKPCKWAGVYADWCAIFVRWIFHLCDMSNIMATVNYVPEDFTKQIIKKGGKIIWSGDSRFKNPKGGSKKKVKPGDICLYRGHVNIAVTSSKDGKSIKCIGGNQHGKAPNGNWKINEVTEGMRSDQVWVVRPNYKDTAIDGINGTEEETGMGTLEIHPDVLSSSQIFEYTTVELNAESEADIQRKENVARLVENAKGFQAVPNDTASTITILTSNVSGSDKAPKTKLNGVVTGELLPVGLDPIETPFVELTIGDYTFGVKSKEEDYPNYISGLNVKRTNGSMNEYTIKLQHQISPGRNPNFIDELLAKNSFNKIKITYGDANTNKIFTDESALITGVSINFNIASCIINYTVKATSSAMQIASHKQTYSSVIDKGSNVINTMLSSNTSALTEAFPKMKDSNYVINNNLVPTDDAVVNIRGATNINDIAYLKNIVGSMKSATDPYAQYYLILRSDDFKIYEVSSNSTVGGANTYEVNINYPDENQIFDFSDNIDFAWPLAYEFNSSINDYHYDLYDNGTVQTYAPQFTNSYTNKNGQLNMNNWWKQVTEFPINATLTCRGLLSPLLLMTYIKVNCWYYGSQRLTSGTYIVTGQEDTLSGSGYRTILSLVKVTGPDQYISIDARIKT